VDRYPPPPHKRRFLRFQSPGFILNPKAVKCLHTFEIQNTANVVAMDETAIYYYSLVRICLNQKPYSQARLLVPFSVQI
jgi:hypothetical protein